ncbi:MAG: hypothetical protein CMJ64_19585 [Planctomycetaceae bacterium]|nr:hypothetical protein [Planctomycetaceae bacterium]
MLAHHIGNRDGEHTQRFLDKLKDAVTGRFQLTSDGFPAYQYNVPFTFRNDVAYGCLIKTYSSTQEQTRYSPATMVSAEKSIAYGSPDPDRIGTSIVERVNLTLRMSLRRFTRLTNGHSKSLRHHIAMQNIFFATYNFVRKHSSIKMTPAMASGLTAKPWTTKELLEAAAEGQINVDNQASDVRPRKMLHP